MARQRKFCQAWWISSRGSSRFPRLCFRDTPTVVNNIGLKKKCKRERSEDGRKRVEMERSWRGEGKGREGKRTLPSCDQHRHGIASNLWVRLITGECRSSDSSLLLRPHLSTRPVFRDEWRRASLSPPSSFVHPFVPSLSFFAFFASLFPSSDPRLRFKR